MDRTVLKAFTQACLYAQNTAVTSHQSSRRTWMRCGSLKPNSDSVYLKHNFQSNSKRGYIAPIDRPDVREVVRKDRKAPWLVDP